jgi:hypothetical protein
MADAMATLNFDKVERSGKNLGAGEKLEECENSFS